MKHILLSILAALLMSIGLLAAAIYIPATADWAVRPLMTHYAPPEDTGLPAEEYAPVVSMITRYLQGDEIPFQHVFSVDGAEYAAFNQKEQQHMADVQELFALCQALTSIPLTLCASLILLQKANLTLLFKWFRRTLIAILAAVTLIIIAACIDFDSLFVLFHKVAFTNDLWLLDPRTDLLIRLMPIEFFVSYAAIIGGLWLLGMAGLLVVSTIIINKPNKPKGE
mgnify:CR=1 FL=1